MRSHVNGVGIKARPTLTIGRDHFGGETKRQRETRKSQAARKPLHPYRYLRPSSAGEPWNHPLGDTGQPILLVQTMPSGTSNRYLLQPIDEPQLSDLTCSRIVAFQALYL